LFPEEGVLQIKQFAMMEKYCWIFPWLKDVLSCHENFSFSSMDKFRFGGYQDDDKMFQDISFQS
jgi:hypothetical protein